MTLILTYINFLFQYAIWKSNWPGPRGSHAGAWEPEPPLFWKKLHSHELIPYNHNFYREASAYAHPG